MKRAYAFVLALVAVALCFGMTACSKDETDASAFYGSWSLYSLQSTVPENSFTHEDIALMEELGYSATLVLNEDGSFTMDLYGELTEGSWTATSETEGELSVEGETAKMVLGEGTIDVQMTAEDTLTFAKAAGAAAPEGAAEGAVEGATDAQNAGGDAVQTEGA